METVYDLEHEETYCETYEDFLKDWMDVVSDLSEVDLEKGMKMHDSWLKDLRTDELAIELTNCVCSLWDRVGGKDSHFTSLMDSLYDLGIPQAVRLNEFFHL